ncbi:MAG: SGNH/GDSL hydrolase family protein [Aestuariivita sp.]|nr:SGNH/GDSL hydrolase family protein [Aestuariivita sp.]MCY4346255.1 SGNH/GDSL hydrolase family protein [Aestuariivita sp.]
MCVSCFRVALAILISFALGISAAHANTKRIMVFGDSNSWGWVPVPEVAPTTRYPPDIRWPGVMRDTLGDSYEVIEETLPGRNASRDDQGVPISGSGIEGDGAGMNGSSYLPAAIASHFPLDVIIIMLGTNDAKEEHGLTPLDIGLNIMKLGSEASQNTGVFTKYEPSRVLIVVPPPIGEISVEWLAESYSRNSVEKSKQLASVLEPMTRAAGFGFFDAGSVAKIDGIDGLHMSPESHAAIGKAVARVVSDMLN